MTSPTPAELEILQILWREGEANTPDIHAELNKKNNKNKETGYTRTLKFMQMMNQKGMLGRRREGKSHIYFPLIEENETKATLLDRFVDATFGGSTSGLMMQLLGSKKVSEKELDKIRIYLAGANVENSEEKEK